MKTRINPNPDYLWCVYLLRNALHQMCWRYQQETLGPFQLPALVFGAASFSHQYNDDNHLASLTPVRTVRLALRHVISVLTWSALLSLYSVMAFAPLIHPPTMVLLKLSWVQHSKHYITNFRDRHISWYVTRNDWSCVMSRHRIDD